MNLLLLEDADFVAADRAVLEGRRLKHLHEVHRAEAGAHSSSPARDCPDCGNTTAAAGLGNGRGSQPAGRLTFRPDG